MRRTFYYDAAANVNVNVNVVYTLKHEVLREMRRPVWRDGSSTHLLNYSRQPRIDYAPCRRDWCSIIFHWLLLTVTNIDNKFAQLWQTTHLIVSAASLEEWRWVEEHPWSGGQLDETNLTLCGSEPWKTRQAEPSAGQPSAGQPSAGQSSDHIREQINCLAKWNVPTSTSNLFVDDECISNSEVYHL